MRSENKNSTNGPDNISFNSWKWFAKTYGMKHLANLLNLFVKKGLPSPLKLAKTVFIPKDIKGDQSNPANYRPISITNSLYRLFTGLFADKN